MKTLYKIKFHDGVIYDVVECEGELYASGDKDMRPLNSFDEEDYIKLEELK